MTNTVKIGAAAVGGGTAITIQSMTKTDTRDAASTLAQIAELKNAGCDIIRLAVPDEKAALALYEIRKQTDMPLVADIHFDHKLALIAADAGVDKIRVNPGNLAKSEHIKAVADACRARGIPIRIGVNGGSLSKSILNRFGGATPEALVASGLEQAEMFENYGFSDIVLSFKASNVADTVAANRLARSRCAYPFHLGLTEAGTPYNGIIKSAAAIGALLLDDIGDTVRVSLTADPVEEVRAAKSLLRALGLRRGGVEIISCPTCGRCRADVIGLAEELERRLEGVEKSLTVAVMGCGVNGPGEARHADIGVAAGSDGFVLFEKGEIIGKCDDPLRAVLEFIEAF
ncbi:MAG: flavodoxin-dependent (E)-4-hydroxy-3-methylbut-2-enyl-diphosphate synthase [Oscillospiraceae bacterium]|nr:flavodoxin-dependent (E)-4-hydroxy-3-methylbut-2-enyl-diphosphate synthase [Oscillospiraceae bacterium]